MFCLQDLIVHFIPQTLENTCNQLVSHADYLYKGVDLSGVEVIEQDTLFVKKARKDVEKQAQKMLHQGMETQVSEMQRN